MNIICPAPLVIHIYASYYGIQSPTNQCMLSLSTSSITETPAMCFYRQSFDFINRTCENHRSCQLIADRSNFGSSDPCPGFSKELFVQYQCLEVYALISTISRCVLAQDLPLVCPKIIGITAGTNITVNG